MFTFLMFCFHIAQDVASTRSRGAASTMPGKHSTKRSVRREAAPWTTHRVTRGRTRRVWRQVMRGATTLTMAMWRKVRGVFAALCRFRYHITYFASASIVGFIR